MSVNRWLLTVVVCLGIFFIPKWVPEPQGDGWFAYQGLWSVLAVFLVLMISHSKLSIIVAVIEYAALLCALFAWLNFRAGGGLFYQYCVEIYDVLNCLIAVALLTGAPWDGLANRFKSMGLGNIFRHSDHSSHATHHHGNQG